MMRSRPPAVLCVLLGYAVCAPCPALGQKLPQEKPRPAGDSLANDLQALLADLEKECQRPFVRPPPLPPAAVHATDQLQLTTGSTIRLTATATVNLRPPVDPGISLLPPVRCRPDIPLGLSLFLRPVEPGASVSAVAIDSVWIRQAVHAHAAEPTRSAGDPPDTDTLITRWIYRAPLWLRDTIDVFVRLRTPSRGWLAVRHLPVRVLR